MDDPRKVEVSDLPDYVEEITDIFKKLTWVRSEIVYCPDIHCASISDYQNIMRSVNDKIKEAQRELLDRLYVGLKKKGECMTKLGIVGANGMPIEKKTEVRLKQCSFCGVKLEIQNISLVSSNGASCICSACLGRAVFFLRSKYGLVADYDNYCWRREDDETEKRRDQGSAGGNESGHREENEGADEKE